MDNKYAITREKYEENCKYIEECDELDWSLEPHTPDEIVQRAIMHVMNESENDYIKEENDKGYICWSYVCGFSKLNEELVDALMYISSNLFCINTWDKKVINLVIKIMEKGEKYNCYEDILSIANGKTKTNPQFRAHCINLIERLKEERKERIAWYEDKIEVAKRVVNDLPEKLEKTINEIEKTESKETIKLLRSRRDEMKRRIEAAKKRVVHYTEILQFEKDNIDRPYEYYTKNRVDWTYIESKQDLSEEYMYKRRCFMNTKRETYDIEYAG